MQNGRINIMEQFGNCRVLTYWKYTELVHCFWSIHPRIKHLKLQFDVKVSKALVVKSAGFWSPPLNFLWKSQKFGFPAIKNLWDVFRCSNWYQSKALIIQNIFYCDNIDKKSWTWATHGKIQPFGVFKYPFLEIIFWSQNWCDF